MQVEVGSILEGKVTGITNFGAFVELPGGSTGMVHISEVSSTFVKDIHEKLTEGQQVKVKVLDVGENGKISLSIKRAEPEQPKPQRSSGPRRGSPNVWNGTPDQAAPANLSFEDMMAKFKQVSDEKISDLKKASVSKRGASPKRGGGGNKPF
ncbi:MAG: S1 RNA-binding domain-containing protein [Clostridiales bacterium]|jgi:S1 RNA binding domain protein|nr:S1 RNA-binding domain-containing protein [Clostridiales bacterium]